MMAGPGGTIWADEEGGALVEFGMLLPVLLLILGLCVEGGRTYWSYQTTITGVRDAARYLSRVADPDSCAGTQSWDSALAEIVRTTQSGESLFPEAVSVTGVSSSLSCQSGNFRKGSAAVATVTATLSIGYPFAGLFTLAGVDVRPITTQVRDSARIVGS